MSEMHPLVIVLLAVIGSVAVVAVGCAIHRVLRPEEFSKPHFRALSQDQLNYMHEVCDRTRAEAFAAGGRGDGGGYNDGYSGMDYSNFSRV